MGLTQGWVKLQEQAKLQEPLVSPQVSLPLNSRDLTDHVFTLSQRLSIGECIRGCCDHEFLQMLMCVYCSA